MLPPGKTILPTSGKIMTGVSIARNLNAVATFERDAGKNASILFYYQDWGAVGDQNFPTSWASAVRMQGSLPSIVWQPWAPEAYPQSNNETAYALRNIIAGHFDTYIKQWAKDAKAWGNPFFLVFAPEMNGNWNPWDESLNGNKAGEFVQAWRHVHAIFTTVGATNVTWVWDANENYLGSTPLAELYPGDAYVDWTAMDGFNWGTSSKSTAWRSFSGVFSATYNTILQITHKPMMIALLSCAEKGGNKAAWITNAYSVALPQSFPAIRAVVWFDQVTQADWRIESSPAAQKAFSQAMQAPIYAANIFANYNGG
jgi:beta-mannanase